jgi:hypothetical protein
MSEVCQVTAHLNDSRQSSSVVTIVVAAADVLDAPFTPVYAVDPPDLRAFVTLDGAALAKEASQCVRFGRPRPGQRRTHTCDTTVSRRGIAPRGSRQTAPSRWRNARFAASTKTWRRRFLALRWNGCQAA